ncbi:MAG TPA: porphobilinogen synthase [Myxococcota bacterium]|nr:porphobilinogen synthase [Myxococcota bacterium]
MLDRFPHRRPRRLRSRPAVRDLVREHHLRASDLVQPLFVHEGDGADAPIASMPGQARLGESRLVEVAAAAWAAGVRGVALFPKVADAHKTIGGEAAWDDEGLVPRIVRRLKAEVPDLAVITDLALDPYSSLGQDGVVVDGRIDNDLTIAALLRQAGCHARAGADIVAPSDMMDGRVGEIRRALDAGGHADTLILAYSAKYASAFYGPFRDALDSAPRGGADKKTYQMDPANGDEALEEVRLDLEEGADIVMVKPGLPYLDVVWRVKQAFRRPVAVYNVSGEYAMIEAAAANGWLDRRACVLESLIAFKRAGADIILTYHAAEVAGWLSKG